LANQYKIRSPPTRGLDNTRQTAAARPAGPGPGARVPGQSADRGALSELETLTGLNRYALTRHFRAVYGTRPYRYSLLRGLISRETACGVGSTLSTWPLRRASPIKRTSPACSHRPTACSTRGGQRRRHGISWPLRLLPGRCGVHRAAEETRTCRRAPNGWRADRDAVPGTAPHRPRWRS